MSQILLIVTSHHGSITLDAISSGGVIDQRNQARIIAFCNCFSDYLVP